MKEFLTDIADAVREKKGTSEKINAQNLSEEIKSIETPSPFAVDFGEEIASGNPAYIGALQEDIDYYNEVQRKLTSGEVTANELKNVTAVGLEFRKRIAWMDSEMYGFAYYGLKAVPYSNLREFKSTKTYGNYAFERFSKLQYAEINIGETCTNMFNECGSLREVKFQAGAQPTNVDYMFHNCTSLERLDLDLSKATKAGFMLFGCYSLTNIDLSLDSFTGTLVSFLRNSKCDTARINLPQTTGLSYCFSSFHYKSLYLSIPKVRTASNSFTATYNTLLEDMYISGLAVSINVNSASNLKIDSIKYICDNCQEREDGAAYTLTLHATVKQNFMNKCTEGNEEYDAEYAASLASANEKGLTLA